MAFPANFFDYNILKRAYFSTLRTAHTMLALLCRVCVRCPARGALSTSRNLRAEDGSAAGEGFDKEQAKELKKRRRTPAREVEKWRDMYRILFPDDAESAMPSPC